VSEWNFVNWNLKNQSATNSHEFLDFFILYFLCFIRRQFVSSTGSFFEPWFLVLDYFDLEIPVHCCMLLPGLCQLDTNKGTLIDAMFILLRYSRKVKISRLSFFSDYLITMKFFKMFIKSFIVRELEFASFLMALSSFTSLAWNTAT
jgi:hypothetical protein